MASAVIDLIVQTFGPTALFHQTTVATVMSKAAPVCCILWGSFASVSAVATIEAIIVDCVLSCYFPDHRCEIPQSPVGLQQAKGHDQ